MKRFIALITLSSCATHYTLNCDQICAKQDMVCMGMGVNSGSATAYDYRTQSNINIYSSGESYQCRVPASDDERLQIGLRKNESAELHDKNTSATWRNVGYWAIGIAAVIGLSFAIAPKDQ
jgi:hypothetical protein